MPFHGHIDFGLLHVRQNFIYATFRYIRLLSWYRMKFFSLAIILRTDCFRLTDILSQWFSLQSRHR